MRTPVTQATKAKGKQGSVEEDIPISYHGVAYVNMAPLLYPGVKRLVTTGSVGGGGGGTKGSISQATSGRAGTKCCNL